MKVTAGLISWVYIVQVKSHQSVTPKLAVRLECCPHHPRSTVRKYLKRPFGDEPSMVPARPKGFRVGGKTAHHRKCRRLEAEFWNSLSQEEIDGIWFADESKITFREHPNRQIDIKWCFRGEAGAHNWYEKPTHPGQINLFIVQSKWGIELYDIYKKNMNLDGYKHLLPQIRREINRSNAPFTYFMHDNAWRDSQPTAESLKKVTKSGALHGFDDSEL